MNYFQNSGTNFQPLMQRSTISRFIQPQFVCIDQSSMNVTATALNTIKASTSQKLQRGSRQYIIKYRNSNASATSTSQSPQKHKKEYNNQNICINTDDPYLKENKILSGLSVKVSKIVNKIVSPCSSLSTQSSNKNDYAPTDKEDDSPLRTNNKSNRLDKLINQNSNKLGSNNVSSMGLRAVEESFKNKQKNSSSIYSQTEILQKTPHSPETFKQMKDQEKKQQQQNQNDNKKSAEQKQIEKGTFRNVNKLENTTTPSNEYNLKTVVRVNQQSSKENIQEVGQQTIKRVFKSRDISAPPIQDQAQTFQGQENGQKDQSQSSQQTNGIGQKRHSVLRLSDPSVLIAALSPDKNKEFSQNNEQDLKFQIQQSDLKLLSSTLQQLKFDDLTKKQLILKQSKKNASFLGSKRKKLKKSKNVLSNNDNLQDLKLQQFQHQLAVNDEKCDLYDQDFQSLADQLENQQLIQKIQGNEYMFDDENAYSEELNEQEEVESGRDFMLPLNKIQSKVNNSIVLPSLVQIGSNNVIEEQIDMALKSKELEPLNLTAKSVCIFDVEKNKPILSLKGKKSREVASLTKIMTCYIICQAISKKKIKQADQIKVSRAAASMIGTSAYLRSGDQLTVWDLLHGLMLPSGNDAAFALAEFMGRLLFFDNEDYKKQLQQNPQSFENCKTRDAIKCFLSEMNRVAKDLKLTNTKYANPHGLVNKGNRSSALDICKLSAHCLTKSSLFRQIVKTKQYTCQIRNKQGIVRIANWENTNKCLLRYNSICDGVKTGVTCTAGPCLTTSWRVKDKHFIITILKCDSLEQRYSESQRIFAWMCEKLGIELTVEEKMPYEKIKQLYKKNSVESLNSMRESSTGSSLSIKQKPILLAEKLESISIYDNLKIITSYPELDIKSKTTFSSTHNQ